MSKSPCIGICRVVGNHCYGCMRTLDEISGWGRMSDQHKKEVWQLIDARRQSANEPFFVKDQLNRTVKINVPVDRIISLVPSITKTLVDLGLANKIVGISSYCSKDQLNSDVIVVGGTKNPRIKQISMCKPDLVIANKEENRWEDVNEIALNYPVWVSDCNNIEESNDFIYKLGLILGVRDRSEKIIREIEESHQNLHHSLKDKTFVYLIWKDPIMVAANETFIHSMFEAAGGINLFSHLKRYPEVDLEYLRNLNPDFIFLPDEPYNFSEQDKHEMQSSLPKSKIVRVKGDEFCWPGTQVLKGLYILREIE